MKSDRGNNEKLVSIAVLNYNGKKDMLKKCLDSIYKLNFDKKNMEILFIENGSQNDDWKIINKYQGIKLIKIRKNIGFARGYNFGLKKAKGKYLALINNDVRVEKDWLKKLLPIIEKDENIGSIGGKIFYEDHSVWFSGAKVYFGGFVKHRGLGDRRGESDYIAGAAVIFRRSLLEKIGYFDEKLFLYCEDADLGLRVKKAGYKNFYYPKAISYHMITHDRASKSEEYYEQRNRPYFYAKNLGILRIPFLILDILVLFPIFWLNRLRKNIKKLAFWRETWRARLDSIKMILNYKTE
jgi:GT2 family glycosyltransferase